MIISNESMDFMDPKEFDDPSYSMISIGSMDFDNPKVYGDTFISDGVFLRELIRDSKQGP